MLCFGTRVHFTSSCSGDLRKFPQTSVGNFKASPVLGGDSKEIVSRNQRNCGKWKKDDFKRERMFGRSAKIPTANAFSELVGMDFAEYGDLGNPLHIQDLFSRFSVTSFLGAKKKEEQTARAVQGSAISDWAAVLGNQKL